MVLRVWYMTEVEYDSFGNPKIIRSFSRLAKDSDVKKKQKEAKAKKAPIEMEEKELF